MTVQQLKQMIQNLPDDMQVLVPLNAGNGFDGCFFSPCTGDSGPSKMGVGSPSEEEIERAENIGVPLPEVEELILVPCGFFDGSEHKHNYELN